MKFWEIEQKEDGDILPCPFCNVIPEMKVIHLGDKKVFELRCRNLYCPTNLTWAKSEKEIISIWNRRSE